MKFPLFLVSLLIASALGFLLVFETAGPALAERDVRAVVEQSVRSLNLQTDMPQKVAEAHWFDLHISEDFLRLLLWGTVILGVAVVLWSLRDSLPVLSRSRKITTRDEAVSSAPLARLEEAQLEADDLASQGHYAEAMHILLFKSLNELRRQLGLSFAASLTSREILRRTQLSQVGRNALAAIIASVERTYFGGRPASQTDYFNCRSNFDILTGSLSVLGAQ